MDYTKAEQKPSLIAGFVEGEDIRGGAHILVYLYYTLQLLKFL